ncbi:unnamed protein product, partial [Mesorhabditis spiculigera]
MALVTVLLLLAVSFHYSIAYEQRIVTKGLITCNKTADGKPFRDEDLLVQLYDHDYLSFDDLITENFFPDGQVFFNASTDQWVRVVPKIHIHHTCGPTRQGCYLITEVFLKKVADGSYPSDTVILDVKSQISTKKTWEKCAPRPRAVNFGPKRGQPAQGQIFAGQGSNSTRTA